MSIETHLRDMIHGQRGNQQEEMMLQMTAPPGTPGKKDGDGPHGEIKTVMARLTHWIGELLGCFGGYNKDCSTRNLPILQGWPYKEQNLWETKD